MQENDRRAFPRIRVGEPLRDGDSRATVSRKEGRSPRAPLAMRKGSNAERSPNFDSNLESEFDPFSLRAFSIKQTKSPVSRAFFHGRSDRGSPVESTLTHAAV